MHPITPSHLSPNTQPPDVRHFPKYSVALVTSLLSADVTGIRAADLELPSISLPEVVLPQPTSSVPVLALPKIESLNTPLALRIGVGLSAVVGSVLVLLGMIYLNQARL